MKKDETIIAKLPAEEKAQYLEFGAKLDLTLSQMIREALLRFKPILRSRWEERQGVVEASK